MNTEKSSVDQPWWQFGHVWLVISGPLLVVVASFVSGWIAMQGNDTDFKKDDEMVKQQLQNASPAQREALAPAIQGRTHAATSAPHP
jgi:hypothetical protein